MGLPARPFGSQRRTGPPRSHSSSKGGNFLRSRKELISRLGSQPSFVAKSSQNGQPVSGLKCHSTTSRTCASSCVCDSRLLRARLFAAPVIRISHYASQASFRGAWRLTARELYSASHRHPRGTRLIYVDCAASHVRHPIVRPNAGKGFLAKLSCKRRVFDQHMQARSETLSVGIYKQSPACSLDDL